MLTILSLSLAEERSILTRVTLTGSLSSTTGSWFSNKNAGNSFPFLFAIFLTICFASFTLPYICSQPNRNGFLHSLLNKRWRNLFILTVKDKSPDSALDKRFLVRPSLARSHLTDSGHKQAKLIRARTGAWATSCSCTQSRIKKASSPSSNSPNANGMLIPWCDISGIWSMSLCLPLHIILYNELHW